MNECEGYASDCAAECSAEQLAEQLGVDGDTPENEVVGCLDALKVANECFAGLSCAELAAGDACSTENSASSVACYGE